MSAESVTWLANNKVGFWNFGYFHQKILIFARPIFIKYCTAIGGIE